MAVHSVNTPGFKRSVTLDPASVDAVKAPWQTFTVTGIVKDRIYFVKADSLETDLGLNGIAYGSAADTIKIQFINPTAGAIDPASQTFDIIGF